MNENKIKPHIYSDIINMIAKNVHENAKAHGFWEKWKNDGECIALMHSELSEALEALRQNPRQQDEHCPEHLNVTVELADCVIRIFDYAEANGLNIGDALIAKHNYNCDRPYKHGKKI